MGETANNLMLSQYVAFYVYQNSEPHKREYLKQLIDLGFNGIEAEKMFEFESDTLKKFKRGYLISPKFTKSWFFGLQQPFFISYPKTKEDILKEHYLTISELVKIVDEAEWHYWNSIEREMPSEVWDEIAEWRLNGNGGEFVMQYFPMIAEETGIPEEKIIAYGTHEAQYLRQNRW